MRAQTLFGLLLVFATACDDLQIYVVYDDIEQATDDGAFARGWLPYWMPSSAENIHEFHDLDTNEQAISFEVMDSDGLSLPSICRTGAEAAPPRLKTRLFPASVDKLAGVHNCGGLFTVIDDKGRIHAWGKQNRP